MSEIWILEYNPDEIDKLAQIYARAAIQHLDAKKGLHEMFKAMRGDLPKPVEEAKGIFYELEQGPPPEEEEEDE